MIGRPGADRRVHPTVDDPVVTLVSESVGGPMGRHAARHPWWTPVRVLLLLTACCFALGMVQKNDCFQEGWTTGETRYSAMCYSDLPYLYTGRGMVELAWPFTDDPQVRNRFSVMEYPVGISYWTYGTAYVTHWLVGSPDLEPRYAQDPGTLFGQPDIQREIKLFFVVNAVGFALLALLTTWFLTGVNRDRPWDAAMFALSPTLALAGLVNWDMLAVAAVAGALWAWQRGSPVLTGLLIGLGVAIKLYPLFLLGGLLLICIRRRWFAAYVTVLSSAVIAWVLTNIPAYLTGPDQWKLFWTFNSDRTADLGSVWLVIAQARDVAFTSDTINGWSLWIFVAWCLGVAALAMAAPATPRLAQLAFLIVAGFLIVNKVYSPQYVLWLLPLAALARPRWRDQLVWQASEVFYFMSVWWYLGNDLKPAAGDDAGAYWVAIVVRVLGELYLVTLVARDVLRPTHDPVREPRRVPYRWSSSERTPVVEQRAHAGGRAASEASG